MSARALNPFGATFAFILTLGDFLGMDVLASAVALLFFVRFENSRAHIPGHWLPLIAVLGVSLALPLFLYLRERAHEQSS